MKRKELWLKAAVLVGLLSGGLQVAKAATINGSRPSLLEEPR